MIAVWSEAKASREAKILAARLQIPLLENAAKPSANIRFLFIFEDRVLFLQSLDETDGKPFYVDYQSDDFFHRLETANKKDPLVKASGLEKGNRTLLDASFGLGYDSVFLASRGFHVTACERSAYVFEFVMSALEHLKDAGGVSKMPPSLFLGDAKQFLQEYSQTFDVVYFDPMYPEAENRSALAKKEMRVFRKLLGDDNDASQLFPILWNAAKNRLVIKRPDDAPTLVPEAVKKPDIVFAGKSVRFDVYLKL